MIKILRKKKRRKNPEKDILEILNSLSSSEKKSIHKIGQGTFGETYRFTINHNIVIDNVSLSPNTYLIKRNIKDKLSINEINRLIKISNYNLIPKIYVINSDFIIMEYIPSNTLHYLINQNQISDLKALDYLKLIRKLISNWHKKGLCHGDLRNMSNFLISKNGKVAIIDPITTRSCSIRQDINDLEYVQHVLDENWDDFEDLDDVDEDN